MLRPKGYVDTQYLREAAQLLNGAKRRSYELMHVGTGHAVLDVGCGPGTDTIPLAGLVGPTGRVMGVDRDPAMLREADARAWHAGVREWVQHLHADALALPFGPHRFDACHAERVLEHLPRPELALAEMVRVTKPGGWVVVGEPDWGTFIIDTVEPALIDVERRLARVKAERLLQSGYVGRQLYRLAKRAGLADVAIEILSFPVTSVATMRYLFGLDETEREATASGIITIDELQQWRSSLDAAEAAGAFFASGSMALLAGRKP